jgi:group I intron endonuclease
MNTGIYTITSPSGKFYIGSTTVSFHVRWRSHKNRLRAKTHGNAVLQAAWDKYGEANMIFEVYLRCEKHECREWEQAAIDIMCPAYNIAKNVDKSFLGCRHTDETRALLSRLKTGHKLTPEQLARHGQSRIGIPLTEDHKRNISRGNTGVKKSPASAESRARRSAAQKGKFLGAESSRARPVQCVETGEIFISILDAANWLSAISGRRPAPANIGNCCRGPKGYNSAGGFTWRYADQPTVDNPATAP